jgi:hypothetical protein
MTCSRCSTANPELARFCYRCGAGLTTTADRTSHYAASPGEPVRALALVSTLMPHVAGSRHHLYKLGLALAGVASLIAAGFGILPVALVCAAIALPGVLLMYLYDHEVWTDDPWTILAVCVGLAGALGVGVGFLADAFTANGVIAALNNSLPSTGRLLELCVVLPVVTLIALQVAPFLVTGRPRFAHTLDALTFAALGGASLALAESIVVQHGSFSSSTVHGTSSARDAFIALTLGFAKPVIYAAAGAITIMRLRRRSSAYPLGLLEGFLMIGVYDSAVATLSIYGDRGVVLTFIIAAVTAAIGLIRIRDEAHAALLDEATQVTAPVGAHFGGNCAECGLPLVSGSAFCLACGTAVAAMPKPHQQHLASYAATSA